MKLWGMFLRVRSEPGLQFLIAQETGRKLTADLKILWELGPQFLGLVLEIWDDRSLDGFRVHVNPVHILVDRVEIHTEDVAFTRYQNRLLAAFGSRND